MALGLQGLVKLADLLVRLALAMVLVLADLMLQEWVVRHVQRWTLIP